MTNLPPEVKQQILTAYKKFRVRVRKASHAHRETVKQVLQRVDQKHVDQLHQKIQKG